MKNTKPAAVSIALLLAACAFAPASEATEISKLPDVLPFNLADARIYAATHTVRIERSVNGLPAGQVKVFNNFGNETGSYRNIQVAQPSSAEAIMTATDADKFKFAPPREDIDVSVQYIARDSAGNETLHAWNYLQVESSGDPEVPWTLPAWAHEVQYDLGSDFYYEIDANLISVSFIEPKTKSFKQELIWPTDVNGRNFFKIPTWWFYRQDFQNALISVYGFNEYREYDNKTGKVSGISPITFTPSSVIYNHFVLADTPNNVVNAYVTVQSWSNFLEDPSYEYHASGDEGTQKVLKVYAQTSEGVKPVAVKVTEQDALGNCSEFELNMTPAAFYAVADVKTTAGCTYFLRFVWPEGIRLGSNRG